MNKRILAALLTLVMVLAMAACGQKAPEQTQAPATTDKAEEKGCGGMVASAVAVIALLGTAIVFKKKD